MVKLAMEGDGSIHKGDITSLRVQEQERKTITQYRRSVDI